MAIKRMKWWKVILIVVVMLSLWTFIVCFPNPFIPVRNLIRYVRFPVDPSVIDLIESKIPDDPAEIEKFVLTLIKYEYDWENYSVPDYVATARQAVTRRRGDCEDRAVVLASILEAKKIPYNLRASLVHYWVDYPDKKPSKSENEDVAFMGKVDGKYRLRIPNLSQWRRYLRVGKNGGWDPIPIYRKALMISGWVLIISSGYFLRRGREEVTDGQLPVMNDG